MYSKSDMGKSQRLAEYLKSMIFSGAYPPGSRIPSIMELCQQYDFSYGAVQRGVESLQKEGLLIRSGRRIVVANNRMMPRGRTRIAVVLPEPELGVWPWSQWMGPGLFSMALLGIQEAALQRNCWLSLLHVDREDESISTMTELRERMDGMIVFNEFEHLNRDVIGPMPTVGVLMSGNYRDVSLLDIDAHFAARQAADYFENRGIRTVGIYTDARQTYLTRADAFRIEWYRRTGTMAKIVLRPDRRILPEPEFTPGSGLFFTSDTVTYLYAESYTAKHPGRSLYQDFPLVSMDGKRLIVEHYGIFPTIAVDWREIGYAALEECLALITRPGRPCRAIHFPGQLVES